MRDVAKRAGVSIATVSHVFSGKRFVSKDLEDKVREAVRELGYRPNWIARSMVKKNTKSVGLIIPSITSPFFNTITSIVEKSLGEYGYSVVLCNTGEEIAKETSSLELMLERRVDGIIIAPVDESGKQLDEVLLRGQTTPVVVVDRLTKANVDTVTVDNFQGAYMAVDRLLRLGHRRIAIIQASKNLSTIKERLRGYLAAHAKHGVEPDPSLRIHSTEDHQGGYQAIMNLIRLEERPTAVFATNDLMTIGLIIALKELKIKVPRDLSVIGFDDFGLAAIVDPPLTVVAQPMEEMGRIAADLLVQRMRGENKGEARHIVLNARIIDRGSCANLGTALQHQNGG